MSTANIETPRIAQELTGKHLTFVLGKEHYGIPVLKVREIIRLCEITPVPNMPEYVKGVLNLRGKIIPVTDLRLRFGLSRSDNSDLTCIVVVQTKSAQGTVKPMGLIVDAVDEVVNLNAADIEPTPDFGGAVDADYILGMAKVKGVVKALLDIDAVLKGLEARS